MENVVLKRENGTLTPKRIKEEIRKIVNEGQEDAQVHIIINKNVHAGLKIDEKGTILRNDGEKNMQPFSVAGIESVEFFGRL